MSAVINMVEEDSSVAASISRALAADIVSGALEPGERLHQDRIAKKYRASHVPVREAFRRLENKGLVVSEPRRGVSVTPLDRDKIYEILQMRVVLECLALRESIIKIRPEDLVIAEGVMDLASASDDILVWNSANHDFHMALLRPCNFPLILSTIEDLHTANSRYLIATWRHRNWKGCSDDEHVNLLKYVAAQDSDSATTLLKRHILAAGQSLIDFLST